MATKLVNPSSGSDPANATKKRYGVSLAAVVDTVLADCDVLDIRDYRDVAIKPSAGITGVTVHASDSASGTFVIVETIGTNGAVTVVASRWNVLDTTKIAPFGFLKLVSNVDGTVDVVCKT